MIQPKSPRTQTGPRLYTLREVGRYLSLHRSTVKRYVADGLLHPIRYGYRRWYVTEYELDRFLTTALGKDVAERAGITGTTPAPEEPAPRQTTSVKSTPGHSADRGTAGDSRFQFQGPAVTF